MESWGYINTKDNLAGMASRGVSAKQLINDVTWWHGPAFLSTPQLVRHSKRDLTLSEDDPEVKKVTVH